MSGNIIDQNHANDDSIHLRRSVDHHRTPHPSNFQQQQPQRRIDDGHHAQFDIQCSSFYTHHLDSAQFNSSIGMGQITRDDDFSLCCRGSPMIYRVRVPLLLLLHDAWCDKEITNDRILCTGRRMMMRFFFFFFLLLFRARSLLYIQMRPPFGTSRRYDTTTPTMAARSGAIRFRHECKWRGDL